MRMVGQDGRMDITKLTVAFRNLRMRLVSYTSCQSVQIVNYEICVERYKP